MRITDDELELFIKKAYRISLQPGVYSMIYDQESPGYITLSFRHEDVFECIELTKYIKQEFGKCNISVRLNQSEINKIDFLILIDKKPEAVVLMVNGLECNPDRVAWFFKNNLKKSQSY